MCSSSVAALVSPPVKLEHILPIWGRLRRDLKKKQELCALFLATRLEFWATISQHFAFSEQQLGHTDNMVIQG